MRCGCRWRWRWRERKEPTDRGAGCTVTTSCGLQQKIGGGSERTTYEVGTWRNLDLRGCTGPAAAGPQLPYLSNLGTDHGEPWVPTSLGT